VFADVLATAAAFSRTTIRQVSLWRLWKRQQTIMLYKNKTLCFYDLYNLLVIVATCVCDNTCWYVTWDVCLLRKSFNRLNVLFNLLGLLRGSWWKQNVRCQIFSPIFSLQLCSIRELKCNLRLTTLTFETDRTVWTTRWAKSTVWSGKYNNVGLRNVRN